MPVMLRPARRPRLFVSWVLGEARLACPILPFMRSFCASHTVKRVKGSRLGDTAAMMHYRRIVKAGGIQEWHGHDH
jgi:hypothetical protein